jgi:hypothetical protein
LDNHNGAEGGFFPILAKRLIAWFSSTSGIGFNFTNVVGKTKPAKINPLVARFGSRGQGLENLGWRYTGTRGDPKSQ